MALSSLQMRTVQQILAHLRLENLPAEAHLTESHLAKVIGTSRFPVHVALLHLLELGIVRHDRNRGFFLTVPASSLSKVAQVWSTAADNPLYLKIADLRLRGKLSDIVNESELIRLFDDSRNVIRKTLLR